MDFKRGDIVKVKGSGMEWVVIRVVKDVDDGEISVHVCSAGYSGVQNAYMAPHTLVLVPQKKIEAA